MITFPSCPSRPALAAASLCAAAAIGLTACSSDGAGPSLELLGKIRSSTAPAAVKSAPTPVESSPRADFPTSQDPPETSNVGSADVAAPNSAALTQALLATPEIGGGFARSASDTSDSPLDCTPNEPGLFAQAPPAGHAQVDFASPEKTAFITERLVSYDNARLAARALAVVHRGMQCPTIHAQSGDIGIVGPNDIRSTLTANVDAADDWQIRSAQGEAEMIVVQVQDKLVQLVFSRMTDASTNDVDPSQVLSTAIAKAINGS